MEYEICQLGADDFEEAVDFINMVFSMHSEPTDFIKLLPAYYKPTDEHMKCHHVIRIDGKIRALVGIYPGTLVVGDMVLKVARIGAVSTHPYYRKHDMMKTLLGHCVDFIIQEGYDIGYLGGLRHRYLYYGYEKCGYKLLYHFNKANIKHCMIPIDNVEIKSVLCENDTLIEFYKELHDKQIVHFSRSKEDFYNICLNWNSNLNGVYKKDIPIGYFVSSHNGDYISEIHTKDIESSVEAIAAFVSNNNNPEVVFSASPLDIELSHRLGEIFEGPSITGTGNWHIYNWESVVSALMNVKNKKIPLQDGKVVLGIKDYGNLNIEVNNGIISCKKTQETADLNLESDMASRLLFGPLPPSLVTSLSKDALVLDSWCPLPLYMSSQDFA